MLNKIRNIEPGTDYKRAGKFKSYGNSAKIIDSSLISISDSKEFSPALEFLASISWKLKSIKFIDKDRITLSLKIKNYEISTVLDLVNLSGNDKINYEIISELDVDSTKRKFQAKFSSLIYFDKGASDTSQINLAPLDTLFERFASLRISSVLKYSDTTLTGNLVEDIKKELEELFGYINKIFLTFIRKLLQLPNVEVFESKNYLEEPFTLVSINSAAE